MDETGYLSYRSEIIIQEFRLNFSLQTDCGNLQTSVHHFIEEIRKQKPFPLFDTFPLPVTSRVGKDVGGFKLF